MKMRRDLLEDANTNVSAITNERKPYYITWKDSSGQMQRIRRMPPPKLHDLNPGDQAILDRRLGDDFPVDSNVTIEASNPRQPNTLKLKNSDGQTTFVPYFDLTGQFKKYRAIDGEVSEDATANAQYIDSSYLEWP